MVLKYYASSHLSGGGGIVALVLVEKRIPFEHVRVDMAAKEHKTPGFLDMHPFGQVPVIDDDGFILYESRAICRYLADKYVDQGTPGLFPKDLKERALVEQAASVEFADFYPALLKVLVAKMQHDVPADQQAAVDKALAEFTKTLQVYEGILGKKKFLAGDQVTLADIFHLIYAPLLAENGVDIMTSTGPNLARWWNELISRPAWVKLKAEGIQSTV